MAGRHGEAVDMMKRWLRLLAVAGVIVIPTSTMAAFPWRPFEVFNFAAGLNDGSDPTALEPGEASDLQNVVFTSSSAIKKREGFSRINSSANPSAS